MGLEELKGEKMDVELSSFSVQLPAIACSGGPFGEPDCHEERRTYAEISEQA